MKPRRRYTVPLRKFVFETSERRHDFDDLSIEATVVEANACGWTIADISAWEIEKQRRTVMTRAAQARREALRAEAAAAAAGVAA